MFIVVQNIHMSWSMDQRMKDIVEKYKVPEEREIDPDCYNMESGKYYVQDLCFDEWNSFKEYTYMRSGDINNFVYLNCLKLKVEDEKLKVFYEHRPELIGEPVRDHSACNMKLFNLNAGNWGRVKFNGRITCMDSGSTLCHQQIFNIALMGNRSKTFLNEPSCQYEDMADLCM